MKRRTLLSAALPLAGYSLTTSASAEEGEGEGGTHPIDKKLEQMMEQDGSTAGLLAAYAEGTKLWDKLLNTNYQRLAELAHAEGKAALKATQKAWIAFRDAEVLLLSELFSKYEGTMYAPMQADAVMQLTKVRALALGHRVEMHRDNAVKTKE